MEKIEQENRYTKIKKKILESVIQSLNLSKKYPSAVLLYKSNSDFLIDSENISEEEKEYTIGNYLIKNTLGQGNFGKVKMGLYIPNNEKVAVKIIEKSKIREKNDEVRVRREFDMLAKFNHINVILVAEIFESEEAFYSVMEYCEGGELFDYIVKHRRLSEEESSFFYYQLINGLEYIHSLGIVHRDLKPENLLLTKEKILKIIDFGLSNYSPSPNGSNQKLLSTPCGSPCYASPEMVAGEKYDGFKIDIWSSGIVLYAMLCGYLPFEDNNNEGLFKKILECRVKFPKYVSNDAKNLIKKILVNNPNERITIKEIKKHPFFLKGKTLFEQEFNISRHSSASVSKNDHELKITISNIDISNIDNSTEKNKKENLIENTKENINGLNVEFLSLSSTEKAGDTYNNENDSKSFMNIKLEENEESKANILNKNLLKIINKENDNINNQNSIEIKNKKDNNNINNNIIKDISIKKELKREKHKYKNIFDINSFKNKNKLKISKEKRNKYNNNLTIYPKGRKFFNVYKNKTHSNIKKNIITNNYIFKNNLRSINNKKYFDEKLRSIYNKQRKTESNEKIIKYLETEVGKKKENLKKINYRNKTLINSINRKFIIFNKKLTDDIRLTANKSKSNKRKEINLFSNNRTLKSEIKKGINPIKEYLKLFKRPISKQNTNIYSMINNTITSHTTKNCRSKEKALLKNKTKKNYIIDFKGHKKRVKIINTNNKNGKKDLKSYIKITPYNTVNNLHIKLTSNNKIADENTNNNNNKTLVKLKTENDEKNNKNTFKYISTNNSTKINNISEIIPNYYYVTRNINKTIQDNSYYRNSTNNSFKNMSISSIKKHNNCKTTFHLKKALNNPYFTKLYKNKKDSLTIKNTVINLNMVNSNLIINSHSKNKSNNSLNNKLKPKNNSKLCHTTQISQKLSKNKINDKLKLKTNFNLKYNLYGNVHKKDIFNYSQNWAKTEGNEISVNKMKNKLEEIMNKLKKKFLQDNKHIKYHSMRFDEIQNKIGIKKITKNKTNVLTKSISKNNNENSHNLGNKTISQKFKNIKKCDTYINNKVETYSKKLTKLPSIKNNKI